MENNTSVAILLNQIYNENCLSTLSRMSDNFVDLVVTSPPYDDIRNYNGYCFDFEPIAKELFRVTKEGGVVVWVVGDAVIDGGESLTSFRQALYFQSVGFRMHDTMVYEKNGAAYPAHKKSNRYSQVFEYMFVLSKGTPKTANLLKDKKNKWGGHKSFGTQTERQSDGTLKQRKNNVVGEYGYRDNIWRYNNGKGYGTKDVIAYSHPATFPDRLANDHILTWSNEGDLVYDPFAGSFTTIKCAILLGRNFIGSEISKEYCNIGDERIKPYLPINNLF